MWSFRFLDCLKHRIIYIKLLKFRKIINKILELHKSYQEAWSDQEFVLFRLATVYILILRELAT